MENKVSGEVRHSVWQKVYLGFKRCVGFFLSLIGLIVLLPVFLIVAIAIKLDDGGPVFFCQERLCRDGKVMKMYKFRSMRVNAEHTGSGVYSNDSDPRITRVGKVLRKTSLDELPQMLNILKGDMAFVGPRPALTYHPWPYEQYTDHQKHMFDVRPGITGWAQINGRKEVPWPERIELNIWYVEHVSLWLDIKILFLTVFKVLRNEGNENKGATAPEGNKEETK